MLRPKKWLSNDRGPNLLPSLLLSLASSGSRRWLFWVSPSLMGLALGKFGAHMDKICCKARKSMFACVFWSPTVTTVNVSLTLLGLLSSHGYFMPPLLGVCHCRGT